MKRAVHAFVQRLNTLLKGRVELVKATDGLHDELFALRLRALQHLATTNDLDLMVALDQVAKGWKEKAQGQAMELMVWNMEFAVDVQRDLLRSLKSQGIALNTDTVATFAPLLYVTTALRSSLRLCRPWYPTRRLQRCSPLWLLASLRMELALLMADAVLNEEVAIGPKRLYALNSMLVRAAQDFGACASLMGLTRSTRPEPVFLAAEPVSAAYIKEQKELAELGIGDWFKAWA